MWVFSSQRFNDEKILTIVPMIIGISSTAWLLSYVVLHSPASDHVDVVDAVDNCELVVAYKSFFVMLSQCIYKPYRFSVKGPPMGIHAF